MLLVASEFSGLPGAGLYTELSLLLGLVPIVAAAGGRWWPVLVPLPITLLPIAGKTVRALVYDEHTIAPSAAWLLYLVLPLSVATAAAVAMGRRRPFTGDGQAFARRVLLLAVWGYFLLNFAFFRFPWPWETWTPRTPNAIVFFVCAVGLTVEALRTTPASTRLDS